MLSRGGSADFTREFVASQTYIITADGSDEALDVDLEIVNSSGRVLVKDTSLSKNAQVEFRPPYTGQYTVRLKLASSAGQAMCYFFIYTTKGGWEISPRVTLDVLSKLAVGVTVLEGTLERFYGYVMMPGETNSMSISGLTGAYSVFAVGSENATDLDIVVRRNGVVIARDELADAFPVCEFTNSGGSSITCELTYHSGVGSAFVIMGVVQKGGQLPGIRRL